MRAEPREAEYLAPLVKIIWPEHSLEDLADESGNQRSEQNLCRAEDPCEVVCPQIAQCKLNKREYDGI